MPTRDAFLRAVWNDVINAPLSETWIDSRIAQSNSNPDAAFSDAGAALKRLIDCGVSRRDLALIARAGAYETAFMLLYMLDDPGVDDGDVFLLHESLLSADPSGLEGRKGSAPQ